MLTRHAYLLCPDHADYFVWNGNQVQSCKTPELAAHEARSELVRCQRRCDEREMGVLISAALGNGYNDIAATHRVPEATIKTWVRRARQKLAA